MITRMEIDALTWVPPPAGDSTRKRPSTASTRSRRPRRPGAIGVRASSPIVVDRYQHAPLAGHDRHTGPRRVGVLDDVGQRLCRDEVRGRLDRRREPAGAHLQLDGDRRPPGEGRQRRSDPLLREYGRLDPVCEVAQLGKRVHHLGVGLRQELVDAVGTAIGETHPGRPQGQADAQQALLRAVVQVALESTSLGVAGLDDARSRGADLDQLGAQLRLETLDFEVGLTRSMESKPQQTRQEGDRNEDEQRVQRVRAPPRHRRGRGLGRRRSR